MNKIEIAKKATSLIVGFGTSKVVSDIIRANAQPRHIFDQISIGMTSVVAGSMIAAQTQEHSGQMIDEAVAAFRNFKAN